MVKSSSSVAEEFSAGLLASGMMGVAPVGSRFSHPAADLPEKTSLSCKCRRGPLRQGSPPASGRSSSGRTFPRPSPGKSWRQVYRDLKTFSALPLSFTEEMRRVSSGRNTPPNRGGQNPFRRQSRATLLRGPIVKDSCSRKFSV